MGVLGRAELLFQARNYSGSGAWLDESGNGHDAQFGSTSGADANDPLFKDFTGTQYIWFPGTADNTIQVTLDPTTIYDYTITYLDASTAVGTATSDGAGVLVLAGTDAGFADNDVRLVDVTADGGGATLALFDAGLATAPFESFTDTESNVWTINRSATGLKSTVVDTAMMLRGTDDYHEIPDAAGLDFAANESFTLMSVVRAYDATPGSDMILAAKKADLTTSVGYAFYLDTTGVPTLVIDDGTNPLAEATGPALTDGHSHVVTAVRDATNITVYTDGVAGTPVLDSTVTTLANAEVLRIGRLSGAGTNYIDGETIAEVLWREALSAADVVIAENELLSSRPSAMMLLGVG